jgi:hypothetical protein
MPVSAATATRRTGRRFLPPVASPILCGLLAFLVYSATLAPTIAWGNFPIDALRIARIRPQIILSEDSAELAGAAATLGIAHPSGYPLFMLVGHLFSRLPLGNDAGYRLNLFSAVCAAVAVAFLWVIVREATGRPRAAWLAAMLWAFSYTFWEHALLTEVHALHLLLLALALWCATRAARTGERRWLYAWAFVSGLGMANHLTTVLFLPGFIVLLLRPLREATRATGGKGFLALLVGGYAAGLLPYLYLPLRAAQEPLFNWGNPSNLPRFWALVSGAQYRHFLEADAEKFTQGLFFFPIQLIVEFGYVPTALGAFGVGCLLWQRREQQQKQGMAFLPLALMGAAQLAFILCYHIPDPQAIYIPVFFVFAVAIGAGWAVVDESWDAAGRVWRGLSRVLLIWLIIVPLLKEEPHVHGFLSGVAEFLPPSAQGLLLQHPRVSLRHHYMAARFGQGVLSALPPDAILLSRGDGQTFAVWYYQRVRHQRPDVLVVLMSMLRYAWYRQEVVGRLPALASVTGDDPTESIVELLSRNPDTQHRPIFFNVKPADWEDESRLAAFSTPLPPVDPADTVTDDAAILYRYAPQGTAGIEVLSADK